MKIGILTPTRGRPEGLYRLWQSVVNTMSGENQIDFVFGADLDDPMLNQYMETYCKIGYSGRNPLNVFVTSERMPLAKLWNSLLNYSQADWFLCGNDDFVFKSGYWDKILVERIQSKIHPYWMFYFDDGIQGVNHGAFPILSKEWIATVGYYFPEHFIHNYPDTWVNDIALKAGVREYIPEIKTEHLHHSEGKSEFDQTYADGMAGDSNGHDQRRFVLMEKERGKIAEKIRCQLQAYSH